MRRHALTSINSWDSRWGQTNRLTEQNREPKTRPMHRQSLGTWQMHLRPVSRERTSWYMVRGQLGIHIAKKEIDPLPRKTCKTQQQMEKRSKSEKQNHKVLKSKRKWSVTISHYSRCPLKYNTLVKDTISNNHKFSIWYIFLH